MEIKSAYSSALAGIRQGMRDLDENASKVAHAAASDDPQDIARPLVESRLNKTQIQANAKVISMVDEALGSLFDEKA